MLVIDFIHYFRLGATMDDDREDLISRLFALLTTKLENGAGEASTGQGRGNDPQFIEKLASRIQTVGEEVAIVAEATKMLAADRDARS